MKVYKVILSIKVGDINKTYNLEIESNTMAGVESIALTNTGNTGATKYNIAITDTGIVKVG